MGPITISDCVRPLTWLSEEEALFQETIRKFAAEAIAPHVREMDESAKLNSGLLPQLFALGLMGIEVAERFGGQAGTFFQSILAIEELARVDPAISVIVDVQNTLVNNAISRWGSAEQKDRYLSGLATGTVGAYALSEAQSGSDAFALTTRAFDAGDHYRLEGQKLWITNGAEAGLFLVFATVDPGAAYKGITCFLVERDTPGFAVGKKENKLGIRASSTCELVFNQCGVPKRNILGEVGKGYKVAIETLNEGRIGIGAQMTGLRPGRARPRFGLRQASQAVW